MAHPLGDFLRIRRAELRPDAGEVAASGWRRVPGLRRDEVAGRAGVSTDYYTRLEQGRVTHPSISVLDGLARALRLDAAGRAHLTDLAAQPRRRQRPAAVPEQPVAPAPIRPGLQAVLDAMADTPALIMDTLTTVRAWNRAAATVVAEFDSIPAGDRNLARLVFLDPIAAARHADWDTAARDVTGILRMAAGREPTDPALTALLSELRTRSDPFRRLWAGHHVHQKTHGAKTFRHPRAGEIDLHYETFALTDSSELMLVVFAATPGSPGRDLLTLLGADRPTSTSSTVRGRR